MILVTGATGFIGSALASELESRGRSVRRFSRSSGGDIRDADAVARAADGCDLVFHLAGTYRGAPDELLATHAGGTRNLVGALGPRTKLVYVSSTSVYGWTGPWPADEETPLHPASDYGRAKLESEEIARSHPHTVVVRPTIVYGPGDEGGMVPRARRLGERGLRIYPGSGANRLHVVHIDDLVAGLIAASTAEDGSTYVMPGPEPVTIRRLLELIGPRAPVFAVPEAAARAAAKVLERDGTGPLTEHSVDVLVRDRCFSFDRARDELGWEPKVSLEDGIRATVEWLDRPMPKWKRYFDDPDEGLGTVYERFALSDVLDGACATTGSSSILHAPLFGMTGVPGLDAIFQARRGLRVDLMDVDAERLDAVLSLWRELGSEARGRLAPWPDTASWADLYDENAYDLVFSFAALWWCGRPDEVIAAQSKWARRGVLVCVPNRNLFMAVRSRTWHRSEFRRHNLEALDPAMIESWARQAGLRPAGSGVFDLPPFPDTAVPFARLLRRKPAVSDEARWFWSIVPYLKGETPDLEGRVRGLERFERRAPESVRQRLAHHRWMLFLPA